MYKSIGTHITIFMVCLMQTAQAQHFLVDKVVAKVGSEYILLSEVEDEYAFNKNNNENLDAGAKCQILENIIAQKLIVYQARLDSIEVTDAEVESQLDLRFEDVLRRMNGDEAFFKEYYGATVSEMKDRYRDDQKQKILADRMQAKLIDEVKITPNEVLEFFNAIPTDSLPYMNAEVELGEIIFKPTVNDVEKQKAYETISGIRERIMKGESFDELAKKYSVDTESAKRGGDLGFAKRGVYVPEFEAAAFSLKEGETSEIIETEFGYHVLQFIERRGNSIRVKHILISPEITSADLDLAKHRLDSIRTLITTDSMSFESAVKKHSLKTAQSYSNNGKMKNPANGTNFFETKDLDPDSYFAIDNLEVGNLSKVVEMKGIGGEKFYRLIKLQSKTKPHRASLQQDYDKISFFAKESKKSQHFQKWITERMNKAYIMVDQLYYDCSNLVKWVK